VGACGDLRKRPPSTPCRCRLPGRILLLGGGLVGTAVGGLISPGGVSSCTPKLGSSGVGSIGADMVGCSSGACDLRITTVARAIKRTAIIAITNFASVLI
jgi:hypothetical protein